VDFFAGTCYNLTVYRFNIFLLLEEAVIQMNDDRGVVVVVGDDIALSEVLMNECEADFGFGPEKLVTSFRLRFLAQALCHHVSKQPKIISKIT